jgi:hypothetical protein
MVGAMPARRERARSLRSRGNARSFRGASRAAVGRRAPRGAARPRRAPRIRAPSRSAAGERGRRGHASSFVARRGAALAASKRTLARGDERRGSACAPKACGELDRERDVGRVAHDHRERSHDDLDACRGPTLFGRDDHREKPCCRRLPSELRPPPAQRARIHPIATSDLRRLPALFALAHDPRPLFARSSLHTRDRRQPGPAPAAVHSSTVTSRSSGCEPAGADAHSLKGRSRCVGT